MEHLGWLFVGLLLGGGAAYFFVRRRGVPAAGAAQTSPIASLLAAHFHPTPINDITISERQFPFRMRADLQRSIDQVFGGETRVLHFCGVRREHVYEGLKLSDCRRASFRCPIMRGEKSWCTFTPRAPS